MAIEGLTNIGSISTSLLDKPKQPESKGTSFGDYLKDAINQVNDLQLESENLTNAFAAGATDNIHQVLIAAEKADVALQFTMQVRNKLLDAYNEIMRMQI